MAFIGDEPVSYTHLDVYKRQVLSPYQMMFSRPPPRELTQLITFPEMPEEELDIARVYHQIGNKIALRRNKRRNSGIPELRFVVGERVLIRNRQQPSGCLLYTSRCV